MITKVLDDDSSLMYNTIIMNNVVIQIFKYKLNMNNTVN